MVKSMLIVAFSILNKLLSLYLTKLFMATECLLVSKTSYDTLKALLQYVYRRSYHLVYYQSLIYLDDDASCSFIV